MPFEMKLVKHLDAVSQYRKENKDTVWAFVQFEYKYVYRTLRLQHPERVIL